MVIIAKMCNWLVKGVFKIYSNVSSTKCRPMVNIIMGGPLWVFHHALERFTSFAVAQRIDECVGCLAIFIFTAGLWKMENTLFDCLNVIEISYWLSSYSWLSPRGQLPITETPPFQIRASPPGEKRFKKWLKQVWPSETLLNVSVAVYSLVVLTEPKRTEGK